jgi:hypothetical protein
VEFDFLGWEMPYKLTLTLLLPSVLLALVLVLYAARRQLLASLTRPPALVTASRPGEEEDEVVDPAVAYNVLQTAVYAVMAVLIMRLKLFLTPHLCILTGRKSFSLQYVFWPVLRMLFFDPHLVSLLDPDPT